MTAAVVEDGVAYFQLGDGAPLRLHVAKRGRNEDADKALRSSQCGQRLVTHWLLLNGGLGSGLAFECSKLHGPGSPPI